MKTLSPLSHMGSSKTKWLLSAFTMLFALALTPVISSEAQATSVSLDGVSYDENTNECIVSSVVDAQQLRQVFKQHLDPNGYILLSKITFTEGSGLTGNVAYLFSPDETDDPDVSANEPRSWELALQNKEEVQEAGKIQSHLREINFPQTQFTFSTTSMKKMFQKCDVLSSLDLSMFNTENITSTESLFHSCSMLSNLNVSSFTSENLTNVNNMFDHCENLLAVDMPHFSITNKITSLHSLFSDCEKLKTINIKSWDTSNVTDMEGVFWYCQSLQNLDFVRSFDTSRVTSMRAMFAALNIVPDISGFNTAKLDDLSGFCMGSTVLPDLTLIDTSRVTQMHALFAGCTTLTSIPEWLPRLNTSSVRDFSAMYAGWTGMKSFTPPKLNMSSATDIHGMFAGRWTSFAPLGSSVLEHLDLQNIDSSQAIDMGSLFEGLTKIQSLDLSMLNTSKAKNMAFMFQNCFSLTNIQFQNFDTSHVESFEGMFDTCQSIQQLDLSFMDTSRCTNMTQMFSHCQALFSADLHTFNTTRVTKMSAMFMDCPKLLNYSFLSHFNTANVTLMDYMFSGNHFVQTLDLSHFTTTKVTNMSYMFNECQSLENLDVSNFTTDAMAPAADPKINPAAYMFNGCARLKTLDISQLNFKDTYPGKGFLNNTPCLQIIKACGGMNQGLVFDTSPNGTNWSIFDTNTGTKLFGPGELTQDVFSQFGATQPITLSRDAAPLAWDSASHTYYVRDVFEETDLYEAWNYVGPIDVEHIIFEDGSGLSGSGLAALCKGFTNLKTVTFPHDSANFDASGLRSFAQMFADCPNLLRLDMSSVVSHNPNSIAAMFENDTSLRSVSLSGFSFDNQPNAQDLFLNTPSLAWVALPKSYANAKNPSYPNGNNWYGYSDPNASPYWGPGALSGASFTGCSGNVAVFAKNGFGWQTDAGGAWWYLEKDGTFPINCWSWIDDATYGAHWYRFDAQGDMVSATWFWDDAEQAWYYCNASGAMEASSWAWIGDAWYGFWSNGKMCRGWVWDEEYASWYYCYSSGEMAKGCWAWIDNMWYGFWLNGKMCRGWTWDTDYNHWYFCYNNGIMARNVWLDWGWIDNSGAWIR